jgi:exopolysaccharide production protein ExoZ
MESAKVTIKSIQCLRAIAALMVVLFHIGIAFDLIESGDDKLAPYWLAGGVDIFFVISGFVMAVSSTDNKKLISSEFVKARVARIVPLYWISTIVLVILTYHYNHELTPIIYIIKSMLFIFFNNDMQDGATLPLLVAGWSLNYEMFFYLLFAILLSYSTRTRVIVLACIFFALISLRAVILDKNGFAFRMTSPLQLEFLFGMIIALYRQKLSQLSLETGITCLLVGIAAMATVPAVLPRSLLYGPLAALVCAGALIMEPLIKRAHINFLSYIGDASYSLYLTHALVIYVLDEEGFMSYGAMTSGTLCLTVCICVSAVVYEFVERPLSKLCARALRDFGSMKLVDIRAGSERGETLPDSRIS